MTGKIFRYVIAAIFVAGVVWFGHNLGPFSPQDAHSGEEGAPKKEKLKLNGVGIDIETEKWDEARVSATFDGLKKNGGAGTLSVNEGDMRMHGSVEDETGRVKVLLAFRAGTGRSFAVFKFASEPDAGRMFRPGFAHGGLVPKMDGVEEEMEIEIGIGTIGVVSFNENSALGARQINTPR